MIVLLGVIRRTLALVTPVMALALLLHLPGTAQAGLEADFVAAREAARRGDLQRVAQITPAFSGHVLEPYLHYWQLQPRLEPKAGREIPAAEVRRFLERFPDTPLSEYLRREWLKALGKTGQWDVFDAELPRLVNEDVAVNCYALQSRARTDAHAAREARPLWFAAKAHPEACDPLFAALTAEGQITTEQIWMRVRLALETGQTGLAARVARYLPAGEAPDARQMSAISGNPGRLLQTTPALATRAQREMAMFAVYRLARSSPQQAAAHWKRLSPRFSSEESAYVWGMIGFFAALRHDSEALEWFSRADGMSDRQLGWKVRAALRALRWDEVLSAINAMTAAEAELPVWRYWKARALKALGRPEAAEPILRSLTTDFEFYGQLAREELGSRVSVPPVAFRASEAEVQAMAERAGLQRAIALFRLDARLEGVREWIWAIRGFNDRQLLAAAELARRESLPDRAINTADRTRLEHDFGLRYLAPYRDQLRAAAQQLDLDEAWVNGLIRQESRFIANIRSSAGAAGLMQLMPATAKWVAGKIGIRGWHWGRVTEVDTNLSLGTYYLRHFYDYLYGSPVMASAAYNAGPGRARAWRGPESMEAAIYAETIPFNETRDYVKRVMANASYYAGNFTRQEQSLRERIGVIRPPNEARDRTLGDTP